MGDESSPNDNGYPFKFKRKQFSIHLCFAMTINKAQEQTIPITKIYLPKKMCFLMDNFMLHYLEKF